ncbi:BCLAF1 and THRAP3 family member 3 [Hippocampus zosterae]|uniref:BCLAF1 and THRAP3 family member 3 n=1 Tax=Hippocampus zosterae TaxID=109293 RepID=UPI00223E8030|nr:BCLAF1 and THRAP3 family member 3 [Hippocampus zosterae]
MSRQMSPPPQSRRFPWDEHRPYRGSAERHRGPSDWRPNARDDECRFGEDMFPQGHRKVPPPQDSFWRQRDQEGSFHRRPSPQRNFKDRPRGSPQRDGGFDPDRPRRGFRENVHSFNSRGRSPCSHPRFRGEPLPTNGLSDHSQGAPDWRRDSDWRCQGRFRHASPGVRSEEQRASRREKSTEGLNRSRQREDDQPALKRPKSEIDGQHHSGFRRNNKDSGDWRYSSVKSEGDFSRDPPGSGTPHFTEHAQGFQNNRKRPQREHLDNGGHRDAGLRHKRTGSAGSSQEQFQTTNSRSEVREDSRSRHFPDNCRDGSESKRSSPPQEWANFARRGSPTIQRERGGSHVARGGFSHSGKRTNFQQDSQSYQNLPREEPRAGYKSQSEAGYSNAEKEGEEPSRTEDNRRLEQIRPANVDRNDHRSAVDVDWPRPRAWKEPDSKNMTVVTEETLVIKLDMSRPTLRTSSLCYSAERQLSIDLVNVARQHQDLPPEASGSTPESKGAHGGAFAEQIITLVHSVKELYFKGTGITLDQRFSAPQRGDDGEEEPRGLTLNQRFSSNHVNTTPPPSDIQPLFPVLSGVQMLHGPGDLRHDLERRRQKRLECVTVTIQGGRHPPPAKDEYADGMSPDERDCRRDGNTGFRRGGPYRMNVRGTSRFKMGQTIRMQNRHNNDEGPSW